LAGMVERFDGAVIHPDGAAGRAVRISVGGTLFEPGEDAGAVIARADHALYRAKAAGRSRIDVVTGEEMR